jgi:hypothetical protein
MCFPDIVSECLRAGHLVRFRAPGSSMHPTIRSGDTLLIAPIDPAALHRGDIILYASASRILAHRVIAIIRRPGTGAAGAQPACSGVEFVLKGDGCPEPDPPVGGDRVLGKITAVERNGRRIDPYHPAALFYVRVYRFMTGMFRAIAPRHRDPRPEGPAPYRIQRLNK